MANQNPGGGSGKSSLDDLWKDSLADFAKSLPPKTKNPTTTQSTEALLVDSSTSNGLTESGASTPQSTIISGQRSVSVHDIVNSCDPNISGITSGIITGATPGSAATSGTSKPSTNLKGSLVSTAASIIPESSGISSTLSTFTGASSTASTVTTSTIPNSLNSIAFPPVNIITTSSATPSTSVPYVSSNITSNIIINAINKATQSSVAASTVATSVITTGTISTTTTKQSSNQSGSGATNPNNNRLIRSFTLFDNRDFLPRTFQIELYEACKYRDTIVFLRPGNGKHFITVMLVKYFAPKSLPGIPESSASPTSGILRATESRKVFFLTKSKNSIRLYASVFRAHTDFRIGEYYETLEEDGVQKPLPWKSTDEFLKHLASFDIHLMLDTTFERLISVDFVKADNVQLLILDDVHKIILTEDGPLDCYTRIIRKLRASGLAKNSPNYRILGLSASILIEDVSSRVFECMIGKIEAALDCTCETYADLRMINKYSIQCRIRVKYFPSMFMDRFDGVGQDVYKVEKDRLKLSLFKIRNFTSQYYNFMTNLVDTKLSEQVYLVTHEMLSQAITDVLYVFGTLGEWCAIKLIDLFNREIIDTISLLKATKSTYLKLLNSTFTTLELIRKSILEYLPKNVTHKLESPQQEGSKGVKNEKLSLAEFFSLSSPKLHLLASLLCDYLTELRSPSGVSPIQSTFTFPANVCSLIYAERRSTVRILAAWIGELAQLTADVAPQHAFTYLLPDYVFLRDEDRASGTSALYFQKQQQKSLHEIFYYRRQEEVLKRFRFAHNCNLLVTSSMSAEGLDINRCNLVLCFDPPKTFQQFIQSKGRVRAENGLFYVLVEDTAYEERNYVKAKFMQFCDIEKIFTKLVPLANKITIESRISGGKFSRFDLKKISGATGTTVATAQVPGTTPTGATSGSNVALTMENAISILNRYCLKLPSDTFTKLAPHYYIDVVCIPSDGFQGTPSTTSRYQCRLYLPINSTFRDEIRGDPMSNPMMAKRSAAFKAVKTLQELGELDGNYYPVGKETNRYIEKLGLQDCFITTGTAGSQEKGSAGQAVVSTHPQPVHQQQTQRSGNRYNRLQARNIASKRRQYYQKKVANYLSTGECFKPNDGKFRIENLYEFEMRLTCPLPEEQNTRGRPLINPAATSRTFGIIVPMHLPPICDFTIYNRSGEVTVQLKRLKGAADEGTSKDDVIISEERVKKLQAFHHYTIENVLRLGKNSLKQEFGASASNGNFVIVPINERQLAKDQRGIDWTFVELIAKHQAEGTFKDLTPEEGRKFEFRPELYSDTVIIPKYRRDKMQAFFYVAEVCQGLTPLSSFPDHGFSTFEEYYRMKYNLSITNMEQPLLDVDHTSSRLNLLTPRYLNRKGMDPGGSQSGTAVGRKAQKKAHNLQQKQILVPELCFIHPFPASFWRKAVCLPCMLYRVNSLLVAEELRYQIAREANIGQADLPPGVHWPALDFGWSLIVKQAAKDLAERKASGKKGGTEAQLKSIAQAEGVINEAVNTASVTTNPGKNLGGRPAEQSVLPAKPTGTVKLDTFAVDSFDPFQCLTNYGTSSPATLGTVEAGEKSQKPSGDDPFASMGDWSSFADAIPPDLLKPSEVPDVPILPQIEIISGPFMSANPDLDIPADFGEDDVELKTLLEETKKRSRRYRELKEESSIVEIDDDGNDIVSGQPIRIGSPTQFGESSDEDDDVLEFVVDDENGSIGGLFALDMNTDWTIRSDNEEETPSEFGSDSVDFSKFSVDIQELNKDISNMQLIEDDANFVKEIKEYYGADDEDEGEKNKDGKPKEVRDDAFEDEASYSDFDVDDLDDDEEFLGFEDDDLAVDEDDEDDDDELDSFDEDDEFDDFPRGRKKGRKGGKKGNKSKKPKLVNENVDTASGEGPVEDQGYKTKSFIYDILKYELLYDCKRFEQIQMKNGTPQLYGTDGSGLLMQDRKNRSRNKRIYDRIYREERQQVVNCVERIAEQLEEPLSGSMIEGYIPEDMIVNLDRKLDDVPVEKPTLRLLDVVMEKFDEDDQMAKENADEPNLEELEEEALDEEERRQDPRTLMANYGLVTSEEEVKFGELLPHRKEINGELEKKLAEFSFDSSPKSNAVPSVGGLGICLGPDPSLILQAITMSNSSDGINLERLETVGDSFLKYSITAFLFSMCPDLNEGKLSFLRSRQISNINLHRLGQRIQLGQLMIASKFEPNDNWCPPGYKVSEDGQSVTQTTEKNNPKDNKDKVPYNLLTQHSIPNKSIADCVEALIGTYLISSGSQGAIQFMDWLGLKVLPREFRTLTKCVDTVSGFSANQRDQWLPMPKSPLIMPKDGIVSQEMMTDLRTKLDDIYLQHRLDLFEDALGYRFRDKAYLVQAFTHNSYYENTVTDCYQRLEFLGDAVLDYLITRYLYEDPRCHSPGTLTDLRSALVNNTFFASLAVKYNFHKYLMMLSFELYRVVDGFVRKFNLCNQNRLAEVQAMNEGEGDAAAIFATEDDPTQRSCVYWELFISENEAEHLEDIEVPKALGDIFESVAGAIYLDSGMSLDAVWQAYYPMMKPEIEYFSFNVPKSPIRVLLEKQPQSAKFGKPEITSGRKIRVCVEVFNVGKFVGVGRNKRIAKCTAAKRALRALKVLEDSRLKQAAEIRDEQYRKEQEMMHELQNNWEQNFQMAGFEEQGGAEQQPAASVHAGFRPLGFDE